MSISSVIASLHYKDTMTVLRGSEITKPNGATGFVESEVYINIRCQLIKTENKMDVEQTETLNNISYDAKIICEPNYVIKAGDLISVTNRVGEVEEYRAGTSTCFDEHNEILCDRRQEA